MKQKQIFIKIAVTGGHATPAIALIEEIKDKYPQTKVFYFGVQYPLEGKKAISLEYKIISRMKGVKFIPLNTGRLQRRLSSHTIFSLFKIPLGFCQAFLQLRKIRPHLIVSFGGYASTPVVVAGWLLKIPAITHEQTMTMGLANKINSIFAKRVALAFPEQKKHLPSRKTIITGNLIRSDLLIKNQPGKLRKMASAIKEKPLPLIYITGGKTGAVFINHLIKKILPAIANKYYLIHQTGSLEEKIFRQIKEKLPQKVRKFYYPAAYFSGKEVGWILNHADLVISRAGANIVYELIFLKKPAILIPIPWSYKDEQNKNAKLISRLGGGKILDQTTVTPQKLLKTIRLMVKNKRKYLKNLKKVKVVDGKKRLLEEIEKILKNERAEKNL